MGAESIGFIVGSKSDLPNLEEALQILGKIGVSFHLKVASAHRDLDLLKKTVKEFEASEVSVFVAVAGLSAALPGIVASLTKKPVIGVPLEVGPLRGVDALLSITQMPKGVPVASFGVGNAGIHNAVIFALRILSLKNPNFEKAQSDYIAQIQ